MIKGIIDYIQRIAGPKKNNITYDNEQKKQNKNTQTSPASYTEDDLKKIVFSPSLSKNNELVKQIIGSNTDVITRDFSVGISEVKSAALYYIDSITDSARIDNDVMRPLLTDIYVTGLKSGDEIIKHLNAGNVITGAKMNIGNNMNDLLKGLLDGCAILLFEGYAHVLIIGTKKFEHRNVPKVEVEPAVMGPLDAFNEVLSDNIGLIRSRYQSPNLNMEIITLGTETQTKVCIAHVKGICKTELLNEVHSRLNRINVNGMTGSTTIREFITDNPYSMFHQIRVTERPDVAVASLLEGRVVIIVNGTPDVLIAPSELASFFQSPEDYNLTFLNASFIRIIRYIAILISIILPSFYISVTGYHQELLPENLIESIAASRVGVPFPTIVEALLMEFTFEVLREAGVRLARPVGGAVSIVGALVIGQAAVQANIVSSLMVIVVALTGIASFVIPQYTPSFIVRIIRFPLMILSAIMGIYGLMLGLLFILLHVCSLRSFGVPYLAPLAPFDASGIKDVIVRFPFWSWVHGSTKVGQNNNRTSIQGADDTNKEGIDS